MRYLNPDGSDRNPDSDDSAWMDGFDRSSTSGLTCKICWALVASMPRFAKGHLDWHAALDDR